MRRIRWGVLGLLTIAFSLLIVPTANAYVDPGTGSFIFQAAIGGLLAAGVAVRVFWGRITGRPSKKAGEDDDDRS